MSLVDLTVARKHCRADEIDDELIAVYLDAAEQAATDYLNRRVYASKQALEDADDDTGIVLNGVITAAILLTCGHLYANREDVVVGAMAAVQIPGGARDLLRPHRLVPGL